MMVNLKALILEILTKNPMREPTRDAIEDFYEYQDILLDELIEEFQRNPDGQQSWNLVPLPRVKKIWGDYMKTGFVRDEKGLDHIAKIVFDNVVKIYNNTFMSGHTERDPEYDMKDRGYTIDWDRFYDFIRDDHGQLRISDYAMDDLVGDALRISDSDTAEETLVNVDRAFNRIHNRSDIAGWFIHGGQSALNDLAGSGEI